MTQKTLAVLLGVALLIPALATAAELRSGDTPTIAAGEAITTNLYVAGGTVSVAAPVAGDEIVAGGSVILSGAAAQDVAATGGSISIPGTVGGDLRVAGGTLVVSGAVKGDVVAAGGQTEITGPGVGGDILWFGGNLVVTAPVAGSLHLRGAQVTIDGPVQGNVYFTGDTLTLGSHAVIQGTLSYSTPKELVMKDGAKVVGAVNFNKSPAIPDENALAAIITLSLFAKFLMTLACALVLGLLLQGYAVNLVSNALSQPMAELGRGFVAIIILPVASIILLTTILGVPFGVIGILAFFALLIFASIAAPLVVGTLFYRWIQKSEEYPVTWTTILIGALIYSFLGLVPVLGGLIKAVLLLITIGAMVKIKWEILQDWR